MRNKVRDRVREKVRYPRYYGYLRYLRYPRYHPKVSQGIAGYRGVRYRTEADGKGKHGEKTRKVSRVSLRLPAHARAYMGGEQ